MTWSPRALRTLAGALAALLVVVGYWWWAGRARSVEVVPDAPVGSVVDDTAAAVEVVVHVAGKVRRPGVVHLPAGSRVIDAVDAAGGVRPGATSEDLNLARVLVDGEQIVVGRQAAERSAASGSSVGGDESGQSGPVPVDINAATAAELEALPGIGPVLAQRIVQWRTDNGPFTAIDVLGEVSGIGDALLAQLRPLVRV